MNIKSAKAQHIIRSAFWIGNHPSISKGVNIHEYEDSYSPLLRIGQVLKCHSLDDIFFFEVDVITSHEIELIRGEFMTENIAVTKDLLGKITKPKPIRGISK